MKNITNKISRYECPKTASVINKNKDVIRVKIGHHEGEEITPFKEQLGWYNS